MSYLGTFHIDDYLGIPAATHRFSSGAAYAPTALTYSIYEEATDVGLDEDVDMTVASPFDAITGCYWVRRQLTAAAGFEAGKNYLVVVKATVDSVAAIQMHTFQVEAASVAQTGDSYARLGAPAGASVSADIADLPTVSEFEARTLAAADYTVVADLGTVQTGDAYAIVAHADYGNAKLVRSTTPVNTLTVDASHQALALTNAITNDAITAAAIANGAIDAATFAAGAIDAAAIADNAIDAGAIADGAIDNGAFAADAITAAKIAADVTTELQSGLATATAALILATPANKLATDATGYVKVSGTKNTLDDLNDAAAAPSTADVADAVWDEAIAGHAGAGTTGAALSAASSAGDPWLTALPGAYADGTAGDIIGNLVSDIGDIVPAVAVSSTTAASVSSGAIGIRTHHSLSQALTSTTTSDLSAATKLWLAIKAEKDDTDAQAVIFIEATAGLTVLAGAAYTTIAHGSLTVGGVAGAWTITITIDEVATGLLTAYADGMLWAECKALVGGSTVAVWDGVCDVARGIVNAVS